MSELAAFTLKIGSALLMGIAIGLERQFRQHPAGMRTNALVCLGAALFVSLSFMAEDGRHDRTRVAGQVVSGIGFLGGGVILREGLNVRGMSTAATLWCSAAVGTLAGAGLVIEAAIGTAAVLTIHLALRPLVRRIDTRLKEAVQVDTVYRLRAVCQSLESAVVRSILLRHVNAQPAMTLQGISLQDGEQPGTTVVVAEIYSTERNDRYLNDLVSRVCIEPSVSAVSWERAR
jgi:putative Mg2+ transporter-C (MgtC) family protein